MSEQHMGAATSYVAPRTCTVVDESERERVAGKSTALIDHAGAAAYVLIAEPGAGKTTAFRNEAAGEGAVYVTVRDFRTFDDDPEWHGVTLFLDGLDESRAGTEDGRTPLDEVRRKLDGLGRPRFRLSCRWADWLAANDKEGLEKVSPDGSVVVVRLDPLSERDIKDILVKNHRVEDGDGFIAAARKRGVDRLLRKPAEPRPAREIGGGGKVAGFPQGDVRERLPHARPGDERGTSGREPGHRRHRVPHRGGGSAVRRAAAVRRGGLHAAGPGGAQGRLSVGRRGRRRAAARAVAGAGHAPVRGRVGGEAGAGGGTGRSPSSSRPGMSRGSWTQGCRWSGFLP